MKDTRLYISLENRGVFYFLGVSILMALFSYFSNLRLGLSLLFFVLAQIVILASIAKTDVRQLWKSWGFTSTRFCYSLILVSAACALGLAIFYRIFVGQSWFPASLTSFVIIGLSIGVTEELIYRGYLFKIAQPIGIIWVPLLCALSHSIYKTALFASFSNGNILLLGFWTLLIGLFLGYLRQYTKSIYSCLIFHGIFDVVVYGDQITPWWVW